MTWQWVTLIAVVLGWLAVVLFIEAWKSTTAVRALIMRERKP